MSLSYSEQRPAYTDATDYDITVSIPGSGSIAAWTFTAKMFDPSDTEIEDGATVVILDADDRTLTLTLDGQTVCGGYGWEVRRTDDSSDDVVASGTLEVTKSGGRA